MAQDHDDGISLGYHDLPDAKARAAMSVLELAEDLAERKEGSPAHILLSHELSLRLAKEQAKAPLSAGWLGASATVVAVFIAAGLGYLAGTSKPKDAVAAAQAAEKRPVETQVQSDAQRLNHTTP